MFAKKKTNILLFSGGSDSVLWYYLKNPDYLVYVNMHTRYSENEIQKIKSGPFKDKVKIIDFSLGKYERDDAIIPLRNLYLPMVICNEFPVEDYGDLNIIICATKNDRVLDKSIEFGKMTSELLTYLYSPQHWIPEGRKIEIDLSSKEYTKKEALQLFLNNGGDINKLKDESFSCYDPIDGKECQCRNGICKPCFRKYVCYKLLGAKYSPSEDISNCEAIKHEIIPKIKENIYGRPDEEKDILAVMDLYEKNYPENIGKDLYKNITKRHQ